MFIVTMDQSPKKARIDSVSIEPFSLEKRFQTIRKWIAQPIDNFRDDEGVFKDPFPASVVVRAAGESSREEDTGVLIGNKYHASDVDHLVQLGVTAVLNCASGGISRLPVSELRERGIRYGFTNVRQDDLKYPILHDLLEETLSDTIIPLHASQHLEVAKKMYIEEVLQKKGKLLFFCVAGQNRSATLALATLLLRGKPHYTMDRMCEGLSQSRPFVLENQGFQKQLLELEWYLQHLKKKKNYSSNSGERSRTMYAHGDPQLPPAIGYAPSYDTAESSDAASILSLEPEDGRKRVEIELLIPGLCTMEALIPVPSSIAEVKQCLINHVNLNLLKEENREVAKSWVVLAIFGKDAEYDLPLEEEAIEQSVQWDRISQMFGLQIEESKEDPNCKLIHWNSLCRFALVIFSVYCNPVDGSSPDPTLPRPQVPWTFFHKERPGAPATLLANTLINTKLRAWDFCDGQAFESKEPIVFSFSNDPRDKREFMKISTCSQEAQQFHAPGEGGILGMGANAIVHRVELKSTSPKSFENNTEHNVQNETGNEEWDAAVKRPFSLSKMLASLEAGSEAGLGKRLRQLSHRTLLNSDGRVLYFYGLGVALSSNAYQPTEYKFEATILARYEEEFSTYTMKRFMEDYISRNTLPTSHHSINTDHDWRDDFSLISVKVLLVSLLNAFRDLTLMGVQAFDFNHLGNVLVSRDFQSVKLLDIDGDSRGSIPLSKYVDESQQASPSKRRASLVLHKPSLDVDLNAVLPTVVQQLLLGKKRGTSFVTNTKSTIWRLPPEKAKKLIEETITENFGSLTQRHMAKVVEWFYAMLKKQPPWGNWTHDIYDAMRCIDHLPIR